MISRTLLLMVLTVPRLLETVNRLSIVLVRVSIAIGVVAVGGMVSGMGTKMGCMVTVSKGHPKTQRAQMDVVLGKMLTVEKSVT